MNHYRGQQIGGCLAGLIIAVAGCAGPQQASETAAGDSPPAAAAGPTSSRGSSKGQTLPSPDASNAANRPSAAEAPTGQTSSEFDARLSSALEAVHTGDRSGAVDQLQQLAGEPSGGFLAAFNLAVLHENSGNYRKAASWYAQSLGKNPGFSPALLNLVRLYLRLGQPGDADKVARTYANKRPENMSHRAAALQVDLYRGRYEDVIQKAKRILRRDETNVEAMLALAEANIQLNRSELAESVLERAVELAPNRAEISFKYGRIRADADEMNKAIASLKRAVKQRPNYPEAHNNLGVLYHEAGDEKEAVGQFRAAIGDYPDYKEAYVNLGNSLKGLQKFEKAKKAFQKALELDADYADALFNLGVIYLDSDLEGIDKLHQLDKSIDYFAKYKQAAGGRLSRDDPADKYISEAQTTIKAEKQRQKMMRQAQMQADEGSQGAGSSEQAESDSTHETKDE